MAQIRQPKFKVGSYKLFRKSYVVAVIQKLKPFINERYAQYLLEESERVKVPDDLDVPQNGALIQNQKDKIDNFIAATIDPFKPFWQGRSGQGPNPTRSTLGDTIRDTTLADSPRDFNGNCNINQSLERTTNGSIEREGIYPKWYNRADSHCSQLSDTIQDFLVSTENQLPLAKYVVVRPAPQVGRRTEIDMTTLGSLFCHPTYLKYLKANVTSNRQEYCPTIDLSDQLVLEDIDRPDGDSSNIIECVPGNNNAVRRQSFWFPTTEKFLKFVLTYLVVFCIIGFLFALVP